VPQLLISFDIFIGIVSDRPQRTLGYVDETALTTRYTKLNQRLADRSYRMSSRKTGLKLN
jgi:hypothetical protein